MKNIHLFFFTISVLILSSCSLDRSSVPPSTGKTNELLVVTKGNEVWNSRVGLAIAEFFKQPLIGLPQSEPMFDLIHFPQPSFSGSIQSHHNIFIIDIDSSFTDPLIETKKDLWGIPQRVIKITAKDEETFLAQFDLYKEAFLELFNENERIRTKLAFSKAEDAKIKTRIFEGFDLDIVIPKGFQIATITPNFAWIRRDAAKFEQGILIYFSAYTDTNNFNYLTLMSRRDTITKKYIPGPADNSYMKIANTEPPVARKIDFKGNFAVEMRGMWELEGDFMGGPFLSYTFVDQRHNRLVTIDGFAYKPNEEKKDLVRQLEAIIYSIEMPEKAPMETANK